MEKPHKIDKGNILETEGTKLGRMKKIRRGQCLKLDELNDRRKKINPTIVLTK